MQMLQQQQLLQNSMNDPMSNLLAQQMAQLQMQQQLTFQQPLAYPSVSFCQITPFLEGIRMEYIELICSLESKLSFMSICSIGIRSRT